MEELAAKQAEEEAAEAAARAVRKAAELAAAEEEEETAEAEMAALKVGENEAAAGKQTEGATPRAPVERDLEGSMHGSSIDVQVCLLASKGHLGMPVWSYYLITLLKSTL